MLEIGRRFVRQGLTSLAIHLNEAFASSTLGSAEGTAMRLASVIAKIDTCGDDIETACSGPQLARPILACGPHVFACRQAGDPRRRGIEIGRQIGRGHYSDRWNGLSGTAIPP